jgi:hypothetical protein
MEEDEAEIRLEETDAIPVAASSGPAEQAPYLFGAPIGWKLPGSPENWQLAKYNAKTGEPEFFNDVNNPGQWSSFTFKPKYKQSGKVQGKKCWLMNI